MRAILILGLAAGVVSPAFAGGDAVAGAAKAKQVCATCHGEDGNKPLQPDFPKLGGQHPDYLLHSLKQYKSGERSHPSMRAIAATLSPQDMADLAIYYGTVAK